MENIYSRLCGHHTTVSRMNLTSNVTCNPFKDNNDACRAIQGTYTTYQMLLLYKI